MQKIRSIHAFAIASDLIGGPPTTAERRPVWTSHAEVASPMSHFPRFKRLRSSWRPRWPSVGCLVTSEDGSWGLGMTRYGSPVIAIINEHLAPLLAGESCIDTDRAWDLMQGMTSPYAGGLSCYAVDFGQRLTPYRLRWIEDCLMPDDLDGIRFLRERLPGHGLAGGEHWYTPAPFASAAAARTLDVLQPDIGWAGGLTGCLKIARFAPAADIPVMLHAGMNTAYGQHLTLAVPNATMGEYFVGSAPGVPLHEVRLTPGTAVPCDGRVTPSGEPGFGLGWTLAQVQALAI